MQSKTQISKISDLKVGEYYYLCFVEDARFARKCKLIAIINESVEFKETGKTELYVEFPNSTNLVFCQEIGIGKTKMEARKNYGRFKYEKNESFSNSAEEVSKCHTF